MESFFFFAFVSFAVLSGTIHSNLVLPTPRYKDMALSPILLLQVVGGEAQ
jgi:hypothetical protein